MLLKAFFEHDSKANLTWLEEPKIHDLLVLQRKC